MDYRQVCQLIKATAVSEGGGVIVHRTIGTPARRHIDPFLMLDHFASDNPNDYIAGFPSHPHRGFVTLTYMLDGHMLHEDSMGNRGDLQAGGAQWMKAASGVIHSEMPQQTEGLMRGFQLWINLPAREKMSDPDYQEISADTIPVVEGDGYRAKVLSGLLAGSAGPLRDPHTQLFYVDVALAPKTTFGTPLDERMNAFIYMFEGEATVAGTRIPEHSLAVLGPGGGVEVRSGAGACRFIVVGGLPLAEPIVQYGPFVMTSREEIEQAMQDYRDGRLVAHPAHRTAH